MLDINKLRYDIALQAATARLIMHGSDGTSKNECEELLGLFAACYDDARKISDKDIKRLLNGD